MTTDDRFEVSRVIAAPAHEIFAFVCTPSGQVAIDSSGSLMGASDDPVTGVGDRFVVHMDREAIHDFDMGLYDVNVTITAFEQDRLLEWKPSKDFAHVYGFRLTPVDEGTEVTHYYDWSAVDRVWIDEGVFPVIPERGLRATLGILDRTLVPRT